MDVEVEVPSGRNAPGAEECVESNGYKAITFYLAFKPASDCRMCTTKDTKFTKERTEGKKAVVMETFLPFVNFVFFVVQPMPQLVTPLAMLLMDRTVDCLGGVGRPA